MILSCSRSSITAGSSLVRRWKIGHRRSRWLEKPETSAGSGLSSRPGRFFRDKQSLVHRGGMSWIVESFDTLVAQTGGLNTGPHNISCINIMRSPPTLYLDCRSFVARSARAQQHWFVGDWWRNGTSFPAFVGILRPPVSPISARVAPV